MATTTVSDAVVFPQSKGTGLSSEDQPNSAGSHMLHTRYIGGEYVDARYGGGLSFSARDAANDTITVDSGICFIKDTSGFTSNQRGSGGNPQLKSTSTSGYDTELPDDPTYCVILPTSTTVDVSDSQLNQVWVNITDVTANNAVEIRTDGGGGTTSAPSDTFIKLGEANPDDASAGTRANDISPPPVKPQQHIIREGDAFYDRLQNANAGDEFWFEPGTHQISSVDCDITASDVTVTIPQGATVKWVDGAAEGDVFFRITGDNITFKGEGTLDGNVGQQSDDGTSDTALGGNGHEHIIDVDSSDSSTVTGFELHGLDLVDAGGGDGIYFNDVQDCLCTNFVVDNARRNGVSLINCSDCQFDDFVIKNSSGNSPEAGFAMEQNGAGETLDGVHVSNGIMKGNNTHGAYLNNEQTNQVRGEDRCDIAFVNCKFFNNGEHGFMALKSRGAERIQFTNCSSYRNGKAGFAFGGTRGARLKNVHTYENGTNDAGPGWETGIYQDIDQGDSSEGFLVVHGHTAWDEQTTQTQDYPGRTQGGTMRIIDAYIGPHADATAYRANTSDATVEYTMVNVEDGTSPTTETNGGTATPIGGDTLVDSPNLETGYTELTDGSAIRYPVSVANGETVTVEAWGVRDTAGDTPAGLVVELRDNTGTVQASANTAWSENPAGVGSWTNTTGGRVDAVLAVVNDTGTDYTSGSSVGAQFGYRVN